MSNQIVISSGAKVRELEGVLTGTSGIVNALGINVPSGIPQLDGSGKILVSQLPNSVMEYKGSWNAATNTPTLVNGTGNAGDVYLCEVAGTVNFGAGPITFAVGDQVIYSGTIWQRASGATGTVTSVAVTESGDALTITGSPITTSGTINIGFAGTSGQYINGAGGLTTFPSLTGFVPYTGATTDVDLGLFSIISNRVSAIGDNSTYGGTLSIKQNNVRSLLGTGYTELFGKTNLLGISFGVGSIANLSNSVLTAERTYTLPDASGTLALTSDLSSYVPYTGATGNVNLGTYDLIAGGISSSGIIVANGLLGALGGLDFQKGNIPSSFTLGDVILYAEGSSNNIVFRDNTSKAKLDFNNSTQTYTFPAITGTIALLEGTQTFSGAKTFDAAYFNGAEFNNTAYFNEGLWLVKNGVPIVYTALQTTIYSEATTNNVVFRDNASKAKLEFNNSTQTYTFPAASGTLALTSNLSGYVPYTGATANVNLGTFDLTADVITGATGSFASSGGDPTFSINHSSGSGIALNITKGGNGEGLYINKTSGTGNAATIIGTLNATTLVKNGGTSSQFLKADGSVDSSTYLTTSAASSTYLPLAGGTLTGALSGTSATFSGDLTIDTNTLYVDSTNNRVGIGTTPSYKLHIIESTTNGRAVQGVATATSGTNYGAVLVAEGIGATKNIGLYASAEGATTNVAAVFDNGNVGIGTSSPSQKLQVTGFGYFSGANGGVLLGEENCVILGDSGTTNAANMRFYTANTERMRITSGGSVLMGIGTNSASARLALDAIGMAVYNGGFYRQCYMDSNIMYWYNGSNQASLTNAGVWTNASDISIKKDIIDIKYGLDTVLKLKPRSYKMKEDDLEQVGFIAQEVEDVIKELVSTDNKGMKGLSYGNLTAVLVKAIQEQQAQIEELKQIVATK
jgi:hypothetical protein